MGTEAPKDSAPSKASPSLAAGGKRFGFRGFEIQEHRTKKFFPLGVCRRNPNPAHNRGVILNSPKASIRFMPQITVVGPAANSISAISFGSAKTQFLPLRGTTGVLVFSVSSVFFR
jgi:hypothetical protein